MSLVKYLILVLVLVSCASTTAQTVQRDEVKFCTEVAEIRLLEDKLGHPANLKNIEAAEDTFCVAVLSK